MVHLGLWCVLVALTLTSSVDANYFIACPNTLRPKTDYKITVSYTGSAAVSEVEAIIEKDNIPLYSGKATLLNGRAEISITIPENVEKGTHYLNVIGKAPGGGEVFRNSTVVQLESENSIILIQTDKPIYKPNQRVNMRIVCTDLDLKYQVTPTDIAIYDENDNKLEEWLAVVPVKGVIEKFYQLSDIPPLGEWKIRTGNKFAINTKTFKVEKYVLPKFEVTAEVDPKTLITAEGENDMFSVKVTAKYTYGKNVFGKATFIFGESSAKHITAQLNFNENGVHTETFSLKEFTSQKTWQSLKIRVNVTEASTLVTQSSDVIDLKLYDNKYMMEFLPSSSQVYRPGLPIKLELKVTDRLTNNPAYVQSMVNISTYVNGENVVQQAEIGSNGIAKTTFTPPENAKSSYDLYFSARLAQSGTGRNRLYANHNVKIYRAELNTGISVEILNDQVIRPGDSINLQITATGTLEQAVYIVLARGVIVETGRVDMAGTLSKQHTFTASRSMSPSGHVVVYGIVKGETVSEVIADSADFQVTGMFRNEVTLGFSKKEGRAGSNVDVTVNADPESMYFILALDKSVMLLGTGNDLSRSEVEKSILKYALGKTPNYAPVSKPQNNGGFVADVIMPRGNTNDAPTSAGQILKERGLVFLSGLVVKDKRPQEDRWRIMEMMPQAGAVPVADNVESAQNSPTASGEPEFAAVGRTRTFFPEAWLWMSGSVDLNGARTFTTVVPDTITNWIATAFAISSSSGLGITQIGQEFRSFQPFFASLTLPYAIKRGEIFQLRVTVFNYLKTATAVKVTLYASDDFGVVEKINGATKILSKDVVETIQVQDSIPGSVVFEISPKIIGNVNITVSAQPEQSTGEAGDKLTRTVLVKPEGITERNITGYTFELEPGEGETDSLYVPIVFPSGVVKGSHRIEIQVTGDVMGTTLKGLGSLLRIPFGCGEQNMITLVPNIVVYIYLKTVNRLTEEIETKAVTNMKTGYERELQYVRTDGSFSAFGNSDKNGSTWLTAFVMKSFSQARNQITVDSRIMTRAFKWLKKHQTPAGDFRVVGHVHHKEMLGGASAGTGLTAFICIALKESVSFLSQTNLSALTSCMDNLKKKVQAGQLNSSYEMAIVAYALALDDPESSLVTGLLTKLEGAETKKPWESSGDKSKSAPADGNGGMARQMIYPIEPTSSDIETWSYVLLAISTRKDLSFGRTILKWLTNQQNDRGGFRSTQDTVIGLQAMAAYAALAYSAPQTEMTIDVRTNKETHQFNVELNKLLLLQSFKVNSPEETTFVELKASGRGLTVAKVVYQYNIKKDVKKDSDGKNIEVKVDTNKINDELYRLTCCFKASSRGNVDDLGMTVMSVKLQTQMSCINIDQLRGEENNIMRVDATNDEVHLYYNQPETGYQCAELHVQQDSPIKNQKPASVRSFIYYQPHIEEEVMYTLAGAPEINICEVCSGNACPDECRDYVPIKCRNCQPYCPEECNISGADSWRYNGMLLSMFICLLVSLIMAM